MGAPIQHRRETRANGDATRRKLLDAARIAFARDGFAGTSVQSVVEEADVSPPALYHHFGNKAGLFSAVVTEVYAQFLSRLDTATSEASSPEQAVDAMLAEAARINQDDPTLAPLAIVAQLEYRRDPALHEALRPTMHEIRRFATRTARIGSTGSRPTSQERDAAAAIIVVLNGLSSVAAATDPALVEAAVRSLRRWITH